MDVHPPFDDREKRFVLAEAIKTSSIPVQKILEVFTDGIQPEWHLMLLPPGRNMDSCMKTFDAIRPRPTHMQPHQSFQTQTYHLTPSMHQQHQPQQKQTKRKPAPDSLETSTSKRRISDVPHHTNILPRPTIGSPGQNPASAAVPKKRGRPSKAAVAQRDADAIARGEVIAPVRTSSLRPDTPGVGERTGTPMYPPIAPMMSPRPPVLSPITPAPYSAQSFEGSEGTSPGKKKRQIQKNPLHEGQSTFAIMQPESSNSRSERSTYPNIIGSLTDTIPTNYGSTTPAPPPPTQNVQILNPPVSSYGRSSPNPLSSGPQRKPSS